MENKSLVTQTEIGIILFLSLFFVVFLWGFWSKEVFALGINFALYLAAATIFFVSRLRKSLKYSHTDLAWIIPLLLLALSFAIYENPFFKAFNLLVFPVVASLFYAYAWVDKKNEIDWGGLFISKIVKRVFSFFVFLRTAVQLLLHTIYNNEKTDRGMLKRVLIGLALLLLSLLVVVPLLSSADPVFAQKLKPFYDIIIDIVSVQSWQK